MTGAELQRVDDLGSRWLAAWNGDAAFADCCTSEVQYEDPLAVEPLRGLAALEAHRASIRDGFPDLRVERSGATLTGGARFACIPWRAAGTHSKGTTLPATNRFLTLHGLHYLELTADGRIVRARGFYDLYDAATQLGILPKRGGVGESILLLLRGFGIRAT